MKPFTLNKNLLPLLMLVWVACLASCKSPVEPEFKGVEHFKPKVLKKGKVDFQVGVRVYNPNNYRVSLVRYDVDLMVNNVNVGNASSTEKLFLKKQEEAVFAFTVHSSLKQLGKGLLWLLGGVVLGQKKFDVRISGTCKARALMVGKTYRIDIETGFGGNK